MRRSERFRMRFFARASWLRKTKARARQMGPLGRILAFGFLWLTSPTLEEASVYAHKSLVAAGLVKR